ncbi:MAG TPA: FTR1 family protein [Vicinamibacteria bacterium]|nr:FTR1 family protein [Vicinamibacteria bacterium]
MKLIFNFRGTASLALLPLMAAAIGCSTRALPSASEAADGSDPQRLVALVDYIGGDYAGAVESAGLVRDSGEYEEQVRFAADIQSLGRGLLKDAPPGDSLLARLAEIESLVGRKAAPDDVNRACRMAREETVARFQVRTMPAQRPSLERAGELYAQGCSECHGAKGNADTPRAQTLDPHPARFKDPERLGLLSPYRVYNALTFGVPGTAMASFDALSPADRWSLAFFVFRLGHEGEPGEGPVAMTLADLAVRTDQDILEMLRHEAHPFPEKGLVHARREAAFSEPPTGVGVDRTRAMLRQAVRSYAAQRPGEADRLVIDAYLQGFEPLEPRLRAKDASGTRDVERAFRDLRVAMAQGETAERVRARATALEGRIGRVAGEKSVVMPFLSAFLIYLREGIEAALLVAALLAGVNKLGRRDAARYIHAGWLVALPAGLLTFVLFDRAVSLGADQRELVEAVVGLAAAAVLFSVSFWLISKAESRHWMAYLKTRLEAGLSRRNLTMLSGLAFLAVYREAAETVLFTQALLLESEAARSQVLLGAGAGLLAVLLLAFAMSRTVRRLPLGPFFAVSSLLLCALAVSFAGSGIFELVAAGYLTPRPVPFPEIPWMGIHPDLTGLGVQLLIVLVIAGAGLSTLRRRPLATP